ncbi:TRAP transporter large permease subunit [Janibacter melonis]|uniref:TRAP transporter large permease subunit n=1 Tax=Janibacter melonis TaxID=262209 RepID=UPI0020956C14|nr:TRAP transporter large permease subunit [Janibacter melonis]
MLPKVLPTSPRAGRTSSPSPCSPSCSSCARTRPRPLRHRRAHARHRARPALRTGGDPRPRGVVLDTGRSVAEIFGIIAGVGLIVGGLSMSGVSLSLARELVAAVGDNVLLILVAGAITCFVLGWA